MSKSEKFGKPTTDHMVIEGMLRGDRRAFERLYSTYYPPIAMMITRNNGSDDEAKDIFQEAVCVLYDKVVSAQGFILSSQLNTYLYAICRRLWLKQLKQNSRMHADSLDLENEAEIELDLEAYQEKEVQFEHMQKALDSLGEPCKTIITDFYVEDLSMQEISDKFEYTNADNAKNQKYKCLQRLKKIYFTLNK